MDVSFGIKDRRAAEDVLIAKAVGQARANAQVLAEAAGVKLAGVKHISYNSDSRDYDWCVCEAAPAGVPDDGEGGMRRRSLNPSRSRCRARSMLSGGSSRLECGVLR